MMLLLGHTGITLALAKGLEKTIASRKTKRLSELMDYRLVLIGSMLPDIIDKPLGGLIFKESLGNGRIYTHTLLFLLLLFGLGIYLWLKLQRPEVLTLAGGSFVHHILDGMWRYPKTYFWPAYGGSFPKGDPEGWFWQWVSSLVTNPWVCVPEIIGGVILLCFFGKLVYQRQMVKFVITGKLQSEIRASK